MTQQQRISANALVNSVKTAYLEELQSFYAEDKDFRSDFFRIKNLIALLSLPATNVQKRHFLVSLLCPHDLELITYIFMDEPDIYTQVYPLYLAVYAERGVI